VNAVSAASAAAPVTAGRQFRRGLLRTNPLVLVAALVLTGLALGLLQWLVSSGTFTLLPEQRLLRLPTDDWGHVSYQVGLLKRRPPAHEPVYLLGGSNVRECITTEGGLAAALQRATGVPVTVRNLASNDQHFGESMAIVDNLPPGRGIVVLSVNQMRFGYPPATIRREVSGRELVMASPALRRFVRQHGGASWPPQTIVSGIMNYGGSYVQQHFGALSRLHWPWVQHQTHRVSSAHEFTSAQKTLKMILYLRHAGHTGGEFDHDFAYNAALLEATVRLARQRGFAVVLMEAPENRAIVGDRFDRLKGIYQPLCRRLAARYGATYVDFGDGVGLKNADFRDLTHLVETGRPKWQRGLARALAPVLEHLRAAGSVGQ